MTTVRVVIVFIVGILLIILALQNSSEFGNLKVFYRTYERLSMSVIMLYCFAFGLIVAGFFWLVSEIKLRSELRRQKKENEALLGELTILRNMPLDMFSGKE